jgi:hypothetical protein
MGTNIFIMWNPLFLSKTFKWYLKNGALQEIDTALLFIIKFRINIQKSRASGGAVWENIF